jgi:hypothetical protein
MAYLMQWWDGAGRVPSAKRHACNAYMLGGPVDP